MTRAALYIRRSKEEHQAASLEVQRGEGGAYIEGQGWTLADEHVFIDDSISRAEFKKRPGLIAMLIAAEAKRFDVVVVRDETRLGGDANRTSLFMQDLLDAGVRLFYYFSGEEVKIDGAVDKFMINVRNFAAELEREKISQRTHEHLLTKARKGLNVGGRVYGYDNVEIKVGEQRLRVEYKINEEQAKIIREIFRRYAAGDGLRTIAKDLNHRKVAAPRAGTRGTGSWAPSTLHSILRRERYRGVLVWGRKEKTYKGGTKVRVDRAEADWVTAQAPELRIIDDELWTAVAARNDARERVTGSPARGPQPRYLLTGFGRCASCGGPIRADNAKVSYDNVKVYGCAWHRDRGPAVCANGLRRPVADVDAGVLAWLRTNVLREEIIADALSELRRRISDRSKVVDTEAPALTQEAAQLRAEVTRLVTALATCDDAPDAVLRAVGDRQRRLAEIDARLVVLRTAPAVLDMEARRMEKEARARLAEFTAMMGRNVPEGRKVLEALLATPLRFTPIDHADGKRYQVEGEIGIGAMLALDGVVPSASPAGFEPA